jgi:glucosamine--fructose-6-phosphate aminotransferase (isomerizing)
VGTQLFQNILAQPSSLRAVADHHFGPGRNTLVRSGNLLRSSKRIVLTGMGASLSASIPLHYMLAGRGIDVATVETAELLYFLEAGLDRDTVVVLVSRSGESIEALKLLDLLDRRQCRTVGVTNVPGSTLAVRTTESILLNSPPDELVAVQTYTATAVTLALLGAACLDELNSAHSDWLSAIAVFSSWIEECVAASTTWQQFVNLTAPVYFLSRGPGLASVQEGILLMHETAKCPASGMSIPQFRHGLVEVTDERFRAVVLCTQPVTSEMDLQLASDLVRMGGHLRLIGPSTAKTQVEQLCPWPEAVPQPFVSIFETVPLQLLAYRTAEVRGVVPGTFRWSGAITSSESGFPGLDRT